ncbi:MAG: FAD binding domain-containing protein [Bacteroidetes bacterium]|nr:FAD binding domain-containing protein [Bacteroidota bacterium]
MRGTLRDICCHNGWCFNGSIIVTLSVNTLTLIQFILNNETIATSLPPGTVLLDFIRYHQHLHGTKIGCREGDCGACTVLVGEHVNGAVHYQSMTSCLMAIGNAHTKHIVTVEGINTDGLTPVQQAMADEGATQCGFCTPGFVISLTGFCLSSEATGTEKAIASIDGNICRCTGYKSIERAAARTTAILAGCTEEDRLNFLVRNKIVPGYFSGIKERLQQLQSMVSTRRLPDLAATQERPRVLGGGTDLYVQQHSEMTYAPIEFLFDHPELTAIQQENNTCLIGPSVTVSDLMASPVITTALPSFHQYAKLVSSTPIRNMATLAGNFINASPIGDFTIMFLALDAQLVFTMQQQQRTVPLRSLYKGYKQLDKSPEETIQQIRFELPGANTLFHFEKVSKRTHLDIASVNSAIRLEMNGNEIEEAGLSAGGVGPVPMYLAKSSSFLKGKTVTVELVEELITVMKTEISPISDVRGSKAYKTLLLPQLIKAHFMTLFPALAAQYTAMRNQG